MGLADFDFRKGALIVALLCIAMATCGQDVDKSNTDYGFLAGANFTTLSGSLSIEGLPEGLDTGLGATLGIFGRWPVHGRFYAKGAGYYALHTGASRNPFYRLRNHHAGVLTLIQFRLFDDVYLHTGVEYLHLFRSNLFRSKTLIESAGAGAGNPWQLDHQWNPVVGFELRMSPKASIAVNYVHPIHQMHTRGVQVGLLISVSSGRKEPTHRELARQKSKEDIFALKEGVLLVRLASLDQRLEALIAQGREADAKRAEEEQRQHNLEIVRAFRNYFDYCRVEFFLSRDSHKVKKGAWDCLFLDEDLQVDSSRTIDPLKPVYTAEFGSIGKGKVSGELDFAALVIMDQHFHILEKPFPYYVRATHMATERRADKTLLALPLIPFTPSSFSDSVAKMNRSLHQFERKLNPF